MLLLRGSLRIPGYARARVLREAQRALLVGLPQSELGELVPQICGFLEELGCEGLVPRNAVLWGGGGVEEGLCRKIS